MRRGVGVVASGMVTAVGYNAPASLCAMRAGISGVRSRAWADPVSGEQIRCARVSLPQRWAGTRLLSDLVSPAIHECMQTLDGLTLAQIPVLVGVADPHRPGRPKDLDTRLLDDIHGRFDSRRHPASRLFAADQAGCAQALWHALHLIESGQARHVIVAGVDSFLERATLDAYVERCRVLTPANVNGFLPGEAGAAVLLAAVDDDRPGLRIAGSGHGREPATIESSQPLRAEALVLAIRTALNAAGTQFREIGLRMTDLSGEHYKFKEAMFALMRLDQAPREQPLDLWHPIEFLGEIGAAVLPCMLAWAWHALSQGYAPPGPVLCHLGSDDGQRFAWVVDAVGTVQSGAWT
jgi:3-oxoacyl-[acyl-carrier-protein] synthase-1